MSPESPIAVIDSGLGGLSVLQALQAELPDESFVYLADALQAPYGRLPNAEIAGHVIALAEELVRRGCKIIVIACNTATAAAIATVRQHHPGLPVVGTIPMIKPAAAQTVTGTIAVFATTATLTSTTYLDLKSRFASQVTVIEEARPDWVQVVEQGKLEKSVVEEAINDVLQAGADVCALGCTHFPFLSPAIRETAGDRLTILESGPAIGRQLHRILDQEKLHRQSMPDDILYFTTTDALRLSDRATELLDRPIEFQQWTG